MGIDVREFEDADHAHPSSCWWRRLEFSPEQRAKLEYVLFERPDITENAISRVLKQWGPGVGDDAVRHHRQRECRCPKPEP